jgi:hypothetical protein
MNYKEVKQELRIEYESFLKPLGYKAKNDIQGCEFSLKKYNCTFRIGYGIVNYIDEFNTSGYLKINNHNIQAIENTIFISSSLDTLSVGFQSYFNEINYRYHIKTIEDIKKWGQIIRNIYENFAVPFFENYHSIPAIDKLLNEDPTKKVVYCDDLSWRINVGLIAAKLNNNPKYNELRDYYKSEIESKFQGYFMYEKCMKGIDFLDKYTSEELNKLADEKY